MQGLITLDFGNTHPHAGIFIKQNSAWELSQVVPLEALEKTLHDLRLNFHNTTMVLCEVKTRNDLLMEFLNQGYILTRVKDYWRGQRFAGMPVNYAHGLGEDRLIEAFYLFKMEKKRLLNIDAGTFLTLDVITPEGFQGGYIAPGLKPYFSSYENGERLKDIQVDKIFSRELPHETKSALSGSYQAFASLARELVKTHELEKIFISGGDASYWREALSDLDVTIDPHLVHRALHHWMITQIEPL